MLLEIVAYLPLHSRLTLKNASSFFQLLLEEWVESRYTHQQLFNMARAFMALPSSDSFLAGVMKNEIRGISLLNTLVNNCHVDATLLYSRYLLDELNSSVVRNSPNLAITLLRNSAIEDSSIECSLALAKVYESGCEGVDIDEDECKKYYKHAADLGSSEGALEYGLMLEMDSKEEEAFQYYLKSASTGNHEAMFSLGEFYEEARGGVMKDDCKACQWYNSAVEEGDCDDSRKALDRLKDVAKILGITAKRVRRGSVEIMLGD